MCGSRTPWHLSSRDGYLIDQESLKRLKEIIHHLTTSRQANTLLLLYWVFSWTLGVLPLWGFIWPPPLTFLMPAVATYIPSLIISQDLLGSVCPSKIQSSSDLHANRLGTGHCSPRLPVCLYVWPVLGALLSWSLRNFPCFIFEAMAARKDSQNQRHFNWLLKRQRRARPSINPPSSRTVVCLALRRAGGCV